MRDPGRPQLDGACDTHMHIYDHRYPTAPAALLRPPDSTVDDYRTVQAQLGTQRVVVVQPTTYGVDNSCTLDAVAKFGEAARAVVVVDERVTGDELLGMHRAGARGARFHLLPGGAVFEEHLPTIAARIAELGWHVQLQCNGHELPDRLAVLRSLPTDVVIDHVGRFMPPIDPTHEAFHALQRLIDGGRCWVKLSAPYESAVDRDHRYPAVSTLVGVLVAQASERMLWASNWPHPGQADPPRTEDLIRLREEWLPDDSTRQQVLVHNPAVLYGF